MTDCDRFDVAAATDRAYRDLSLSEHQPVVGITANYGEHESRLAEAYYKMVARAGATPVILPPLADARHIEAALDGIDALLLSGGADVNPLYLGEQPQPRLGSVNAERDLPELLTVRMAFNRQMPVLGICRGMQVLATALGGKVHQDIAGVASLKHSQEADRSEPTHTVTIRRGTALCRLFAPDDSEADAVVHVNSFHHQAVSSPGPHMHTVATAADGIIEALEADDYRPVIGVQWHPECMGDSGLPLFRWLTDEARAYHRVRRLHDRMLTLDTHCDTPMLFTQDIDFARRDPRTLVDLPKMADGRIDAVVMVAYLPQAMATDPTQNPKAFADDIFDRIETMVGRCQHRVALARTPDQLVQNKLQGRRSVMLGIENGLALCGDVRNVEHFAGRGVVYITLCHNGDNDLCDSASRSVGTHGGLSLLGRQVIEEMNRRGVMVDLSHGGERSFYDAIETSRLPIVCSHSSARALCDHPRNLTDEQMRALAKSGGVCQITLYNGFLRTDGCATIADAVAHIDHAVRVMGIDHVGIGTDFDGDGGVPGLADASQLTNMTRRLLERRYSEADIQKIWGGNFLRVMRQVQAARSI